MRKIEIDREAFVETWNAGVNVRVMAKLFSCSVGKVYQWQMEFGLKPRPRNAWRGNPALAPKKDDAPSKRDLPKDLSDALIASKGKWSLLSAIAERHGLTMTQVQQQYHRARTNG